MKTMKEPKLVIDENGKLTTINSGVFEGKEIIGIDEPFYGRYNLLVNHF